MGEMARSFRGTVLSSDLNTVCVRIEGSAHVPATGQAVIVVPMSEPADFVSVKEAIATGGADFDTKDQPSERQRDLARSGIVAPASTEFPVYPLVIDEMEPYNGGGTS